MDVSPDLARQSLDDVQSTMNQVRRAVAGAGTDWMLIVWGLVWIGCYITTHLLIPDRVNWIWLVWLIGNAGGITGMAVIGTIYGRRKNIRSEQARKLGWRMFWFWLALAVFANLWLVILWPWHGLQLNVFLVTLIMFAYVIIGLWMESRFFIGLGLAVTVTAVTGYLLVIFTDFAYFNLWMAFTGGGALLGSGVYIHRMWR